MNPVKHSTRHHVYRSTTHLQITILDLLLLRYSLNYLPYLTANCKQPSIQHPA